MKTKEILKHATVCEKCGGEGPEAFSAQQAQRDARDRGWAEVHGKTLCAECRK